MTYTPKPQQVELLAKAFHIAYERLSPVFGWTSQTPVEWEYLPDNNRNLMLATVAELIRNGAMPWCPAERLEAYRELAHETLKMREWFISGQVYTTGDMGGIFAALARLEATEHE